MVLYPSLSRSEITLISYDLPGSCGVLSVVSRGVMLGAWCLANISGSESTGISELTSENLPNQYTQYETRRRYFTTPPRRLTTGRATL